MHYRSSASFLGLPLIHVAIGAAPGASGVRGIARGWIAIGDIAFGVLFALGGLAAGGFCLGGLAVGLVSLAGLAIGGWALGGLAVGVFALGGAAIAAWAATGGLAVASKYALGGLAVAADANNEVARAYFEASAFFRMGNAAAQYSRWLLVLPILSPLFLWWVNRGRGATSRPTTHS